MEEKNGDMEKRKNTGEQYLYALIRCAEWIDKPYKMLAEKNKTRPEVMKELYLCACDGVPIEKAIEAVEKNPPEGALRFIRKKFLENTEMDEYQEQITGIKETTTSLEKEVKQMSGMLKHIVEHVPNFDSMFPEERDIQENVPEFGTKEGIQENVSETGTKEEIRKNVSKPGVRKEASADMQETMQEDVPKFGTKRKNRSVRFPWEKKKGLADFIEKSLDAGYSNEQLEYLLDCMEEGLTVEEIERFSSPKLPVEVMRRLRYLEERKEIE